MNSCYFQIDIDNVTHSEVNGYLTDSSKTNGVSQFVKYHYNLIKLLQDRFNFRFVGDLISWKFK